GEDRTRLLPAIDLDSILLSRLWRLSRAGSESLPKTADALAPEGLRLPDSAEDSFEQHPGQLSLRQWLTAPPRQVLS
ncbi:UNVERIFIED_CONTAM: ribonuclease BN, partial [Salmonella enterica subsp. enterica serovar Weltevreden]